jgi:hypothetical protein
MRSLARLGTLGVLAIAMAAFAFGQDANDDVAQLKAQVAQQQKQIEELTRKLDALINSQGATPARAATDGTGRSSTDAATRPLVASTTPIFPTAPIPEPSMATPAPLPPQDRPSNDSSPLQLKVGDAYITPIGFLDFTSVYRSHDGGSGIGTNFGSIPYGNVFQNNLSEERLSMQNSRIGFRVDAMVHDAHVLGYMEADFLGNNPTNVAVSSNSNTLRSRLYWVDIRKDQWEVLGGQTWSLITPGRTGISPLPGNLFYSQDIDVNYQAGLVWGRIPELRFVYHPSDKAAFAVALDHQEQYVGGSAGGSLATFPSTLTTYPGGELNNQTTTLSVPNVFPDVIAKLALDPSSRFHFEIGGVERAFRVWNPNNLTHYSTVGGGGFLNLNVDIGGNFRLLTNNFWSDGGGRYIFGQAPDLVARSDGSISLIHAASTVSGFEWNHKNTLLYGYYGGIYVGKNVIIDTTGKKPALVGYGYTGAPAGQNRSTQEITFGWNQTFWRDPRYGALTFMTQYSYLVRNPWYIAPGSPEDAHLNMLFLNLRYTLPGAAPAMK